MSILLTARGLAKSYGSRTLLENIELVVSTGDKIALVGVNGAGKSTFLSLLAGTEVADEGELSRKRGLRAAYLPQLPPVNPERTAREEIAMGLAETQHALTRLEVIAQKLSGAQTEEALQALLEEQAELQRFLDERGGWSNEHKVKEMVEAVGLHAPDRKLGILSGGEKKRAALGRILLEQPELLLLDEPTNHLDADTTLWLEDTLSQYTGGLVFVTHDRYFLDRLATRTLEIDKGRCFGYEGGFEEYLQGKADRLALAARAEETRLNLLRTELEWLRRGPKARGTKQKARIERAHTLMETQHEKAAKTLDLGLAPNAPKLGKTILEVNNLSVKRGDRQILKDVSFSIKVGERIGIIGPNGIGKSTLLAAILGNLSTEEKQVVLGQRTQIAHFAQHRDALPQDQSIWEVVGNGSDYVDVGERRYHMAGYLARFLFDNASFRQPIKSLSGGEKARVELAILLQKQANVLLFDEPTNDLDLPTLQSLEATLTEFGGSALVVTHDRYFLDKVATAILVLEAGPEGATLTRYEGNYENYREAKAREQQAKKAESAAAAPKKEERRESVTSTPKKFGATEARELAEIGKKIEQAEEVKAALEQRLADPELYRSASEELKKIQAGIEKTTKLIESLYQRWEELELLRP